MAEPSGKAAPGASRRTIEFLAEDAARRRDLVHKRRWALGLLLGMAGSFLLTFLVRAPGFWTMLARHAIEAGLAGGLADWFAVTALFRRPLGLPIPYTGLIEDQQVHLARTVGTFVERNFFSPELMAERVRDLDPAGRAAAWLRRDENASALARQLGRLLPRAVAALGEGAFGEGAVAPALRRILVEELERIDLAALLGHALLALADSRGANLLLDQALDKLVDVVFANADGIYRAVGQGRPWWMPRSVDGQIATALLRGLDAFVRDFRRPDSPSRTAMRAGLEQVARGLIETDQYHAQVDAIRRRMIDDPSVRALLRAALHRVGVAPGAEGARAEDGPSTQTWVVSIVKNFYRALDSDDRLRHDLNTLLTSVARQTAAALHGEIGAYISEVVESWDARLLADRVESTIGANLQFIRINGTIVGALVGCVLYIATSLLS